MSIDVIPLFGMEQEKEIKLRSKIFSHNLRFNTHVNVLFKLSSKRLTLQRSLEIKDCAANNQAQFLMLSFYHAYFVLCVHNPV